MSPGWLSTMGRLTPLAMTSSIALDDRSGREGGREGGRERGREGGREGGRERGRKQSCKKQAINTSRGTHSS